MTTRAEHHADSDEPKVRDAKLTIARILRRRTSREDAISSKGLADATDIKATTVRDCIKEIRAERDLPVVSCSRGYYCITSADDLSREIERIEDEIRTREETKRELTRAFNRSRYE